MLFADAVIFSVALCEHFLCVHAEISRYLNAENVLNETRTVKT